MQGLPHDVPLSDAGDRSSWYASINGDGDGNGNGDDSKLCSSCGTDGDVGGGGEGEGGGGVKRCMNRAASVVAIAATGTTATKKSRSGVNVKSTSHYRVRAVYPAASNQKFTDPTPSPKPWTACAHIVGMKSAEPFMTRARHPFCCAHLKKVSPRSPWASTGCV